MGHLHDDVIWLQVPECFEASYCIQYFFFCEESLVRDTNLHYKDCSEMHSGSCRHMTSSCRCPIGRVFSTSSYQWIFMIVISESRSCLLDARDKGFIICALWSVSIWKQTNKQTKWNYASKDRSIEANANMTGTCLWRSLSVSLKYLCRVVNSISFSLRAMWACSSLFLAFSASSSCCLNFTEK